MQRMDRNPKTGKFLKGIPPGTARPQKLGAPAPDVKLPVDLFRSRLMRKAK